MHVCLADRAEHAQPTPLRSLTAVLIAASLASMTAPTAIAAGTDVALFRNGDRLTGEIKSLDRGKVSFDADATGVIKLEWDDIDQLFSTTTFELILDSGAKHYGTLIETTEDSVIRLQTQDGILDLPMQTVVRMTPIKSKLIDRMDMSVDAGYSLAKANGLEQTNLGYDFEYREEKRQISFDADSSTSSSETDAKSKRVFTTLNYRRFVDAQWDPFAIGQVERNDELDIDRRITLGGGMSRWLRDTNASRISFGGGLVRSIEEDAGSTDTTSDTEAVVGMDLEWFRYDEPELDVSMQFNVYRRLSGSHEPRGNLDVNFRWEIFKDFFWGLNVYYTFDQQTDTQEATTDYGVFTSLGWKL
jgi:hypothetical protein